MCCNGHMICININFHASAFFAYTCIVCTVSNQKLKVEEEAKQSQMTDKANFCIPSYTK